MADWQSIARTTITRALVAFVLVSIGFAAGTHVARQAAPSPAPLIDGDTQAPASHVVVSYMHATFRCSTCNTIEQMTVKTTQTGTDAINRQLLRRQQIRSQTRLQFR